MVRRKKTHEEFVQEVRYKYGDEYIILSKYIDSKTKIKVGHNCKKCNYHEWEITPSNLLVGYGCPECSKVKIGEKLKKTHGQFLEQLNKVHGEGVYVPLEEYINNHTKILVRHNCKKCGNHEWSIKPNDLLQNHGCPVCSNRKVVLGINAIWDTDRWMVDLGISEEDAKKYSKCSNKKIIVTCPDCGKEKKIKINDIYKRRSISCSCGDGKSYPEKFIMSVLGQLGLEFKAEYSPNWIKTKRYDFYIKDIKMIIETHGRQHYEENSFKYTKNRTLEEQINDGYKRETALSNGIKHYIELDCSESNLEYIQNSILNSELAKLFDLSNINWLKCAEFANKNIVKEVCEYWNNKEKNETTIDLGKVFKLSRVSIINYLKRGVKLGWCDYNPKEEMKKIGEQNGKLIGKTVEIFKNNQSLGVFPSCHELERQSEELFGVKLFQSNIGDVCTGNRKHHKGFTLKYVKNNNSNVTRCNNEILAPYNDCHINKGEKDDKQKLMIIRGNKVLIDKECVDLVQYFNSIGLDTKYSCSGHGKDTFEIIFEDYITDEQMESFISKYRNKYNHSLFLGKFSKWCRVMSGKMVYNWIYTAKDVRSAKITYIRIISKDRGEY